MRLSGRSCLLRAASERRGVLLGLGAPPTDAGAAARRDAEAVRRRVQAERPLTADMLKLWFVGPTPEEPLEQSDVWPA